jgi:hypothetical protein
MALRRSGHYYVYRGRRLVSEDQPLLPPPPPPTSHNLLGTARRKSGLNRSRHPALNNNKSHLKESRRFKVYKQQKHCTMSSFRQDSSMYTVKKVRDFPVRYIEFFLAGRVWSVTSRLGTGKIITFLQCRPHQNFLRQ